MSRCKILFRKLMWGRSYQRVGQLNF